MRSVTACIGVLLMAVVSQARLDANNAKDFVEFQTFELDGEISDMMWCGTNDETILVQTSDGSIYRSRDRGSTWKRLKSIMEKYGSEVSDEGQEVSKHFLKLVCRSAKYTK